ncbi:MAG: isoprenyl transferase [Smithellaceae bacterium]|nr:isoprenyl transferase [Smithellaceae bacterium]
MEKIDLKRLPRHIAIIMDGNGRWAAQHTLGRASGHKKGADAVRTVVKTCREIGIGYLTLYAFSVENWLRPAEEVSVLMKLLEEYLNSELASMIENDIRINIIGDLEELRPSIRKALKEAMTKTAHCRTMVLTIALSYGGRDEIVMAVRKIAADVTRGKIVLAEISKELLSTYLYTATLPDPDLLIRTSGEYRLSNFLLWQSAYTEFYFTDVLWPDFQKKDLIAAIAEFQKRERRFGLTSDQVREEMKG